MTHRDQNHQLLTELRLTATKLAALMPVPADHSHRVTYERQTALHQLRLAIRWLELDTEAMDGSERLDPPVHSSSVRHMRSYRCVKCGGDVISASEPADQLCDRCRESEQQGRPLPLP